MIFFVVLWIIKLSKIMNIFIQKNRILLLHLAFWGVYFSFFLYLITFSRHGEEPDYDTAFADAFAQIGTMALLSYLNYFYFLPRFLKNQNAGRYIIEFIVPFIVLISLSDDLKT